MKLVIIMKKYISIILAFVFSVLSVLPVCAESDYGLVCNEGTTAQRRFIDVTKASAPFERAGFGNASQTSYYSLLNSAQLVTGRAQLNDVNREFYDYAASLSFDEINASSSDKTFLHAYYFSTPLTVDEFNKEFNIQYIFDALNYDYPEIFYLGLSYQYWNNISGEIVRVDLLPYYDSTFTAAVNSDLSNPSALYSSMMAVVNNTVFNNCNNRYDLLKAIHDFLCNTVTYTYQNQTSWSTGAYNPVQSPLGALVFGKAVCQGYAEAFKLFCDHYKIPCITVIGDGGSPGNYGPHMWNAVKMVDGKWYLVDVTWDDQSSIYYDFFLTGLSTVPTSFTKISFETSHISQDCQVYTYSYGTTINGLKLPYPIFSSNASTITTSTRTAFGATENAVAVSSEKMLYASIFNSQNAVFYNGLNIQVSSYATGTQFSAPTGTNSALESWTLISLGDADCDGDCDAEDYAAVVNKALGISLVSTNADKAADVNLDGVIDVLDAMIYERCSSGSNTEIIVA